ncbi:MAG: DUF1571 domain-containing protein [Vicingaceae bacterium]
MFSRTKEIRSLSFRMTKKERIEGEILLQTSTVKLTLDPLRIYSRQLFPKEGLEILYCNNEHGNKALVNPNGFPWFTLKLDPMGSTMRNNQHHTLLNSGYDHVVSILEFLFDKYGDETKSMINSLPDVTWQDIPCYAVEFNNPNFKYINYQVQPGETFLDICNRLKISEHMVMEINSTIDDFDESLKTGEVITIPNDYSPRMLIYIDKTRQIPLLMKVYDDKGVYEIYEYYDVIVDPTFRDEEFTEDYGEYDF